MRAKRHVLGLLAASLLGLAGCQDTLTAPDPTPAQSTTPAKAQAANTPTTASRYACFISVATPNGPSAYRYWRMRLELPKNALAVNGDTAIYRFRVYGPEKRVEQLANCVIPRTALALQIVSRRFHPGGSSAASDPGAEPIGEVTTQDCIWNGEMFVCDGLVVVAPRAPFCVEHPNDPACTGGYPKEPYVDPCEGDYNCEPGGGGSNPCATCSPNAPVPCQTGDATIDDPAVQIGYRNLWAGSNADANLAQRVERGGWIVRSASGSFHVEEWTNMTGTFCGMDGSPPAPYGGTVVGFVHTHPYAIGEDVVNCEWQIVPYGGKPSKPDQTTSAQLGPQFGYGTGLPGYILDKNGIVKFVGYAAVVDQRHDRCGY